MNHQELILSTLPKDGNWTTTRVIKARIYQAGFADLGRWKFANAIETLLRMELIEKRRAGQAVEYRRTQ